METSTPETRIAVLEEKVRNEEKDICTLKTDIIDMINKGFMSVEKKIDELIKTYDDRMDKIDKKIENRIRESNEKYAELKKETEEIKEESRKGINSIKTDLKLISLKLFVLISVMVFLLQEGLKKFKIV